MISEIRYVSEKSEKKNVKKIRIIKYSKKLLLKNNM